MSAFDIPTALLGVLGLSQVVYVAGKLVTPPAISELNEQIDKLQKAEKNLKDKLVEADSIFLTNISLLVADSDKVKSVKAAYTEYAQAWETSVTVFESALGTLARVPPMEPTPPFVVPSIIAGRLDLKRGRVGEPYEVALVASGGAGPYTWDVVEGALPGGLQLAKQGMITGNPGSATISRFTLRATDAAGLSRTRDFSITVDA